MSSDAGRGRFLERSISDELALIERNQGPRLRQLRVHSSSEVEITEVRPRPPAVVMDIDRLAGIQPLPPKKGAVSRSCTTAKKANAAAAKANAKGGKPNAEKGKAAARPKGNAKAGTAAAVQKANAKGAKAAKAVKAKTVVKAVVAAAVGEQKETIEDGAQKHRMPSIPRRGKKGDGCRSKYGGHNCGSHKSIRRSDISGVAL